MPEMRPRNMAERTIKIGANTGKSFFSGTNWRKGDPTSYDHTVWPKEPKPVGASPN